MISPHRLGWPLALALGASLLLRTMPAVSGCEAGEARLQPWIADLSSPDVSRRMSAASHLALLKGRARPALPALLDRIWDPDPHVSGEVRRAIGAIVSPQVPSHSYGMFNAFGDGPDFGPSGVIASIGRNVRGPGGSGTSHDKRGILMLARSLGARAAPTIPDIVQLIRDEIARKEGFWCAEEGLRALSRMGPAGIATLRPFLEDETVRGYAIHGMTDSPQAASALVPELIHALHDKWPDVREDAAMALGLARPVRKDAFDALIASLRDPEPMVVEAAAESIGWMGDAARPAVPSLAKFLVDPKLQDVLDPSEALLHLGPAAVAALPELISSMQADSFWGEGTQTHEVLAAIGEPAVAALIKSLGSGAPEPRAMAALALGQMPAIAHAALPALVKAEAHPDPKVRENAADARAAIAESATADMAALGLQTLSADEFVVWRAYEILSRLPKERLPEAMPLFRRCLEDPSPNMPRDCAMGLGRMGAAAAPALPLLAARLARTDETRTEMIQALERIGPDARIAVPALCGVLAGGDSIDRADAARALGAMGAAAAEAAPLLEELQEDDDWDVAVAMSDALSRIRAR